MDVETIRLLYQYNDWVNQMLLDVAEQVPADRLHDSFGTSFESIHGTLVHILGAEISWLGRWQGASPPRRLNPTDVPDLATLRERWAAHQAELEAFLAEVTTERLDATVAYVTSAGEPNAQPLGWLMLHVVNHGTHHRSELADLLTRTGYPPPDTGLLSYYRRVMGS